MGMVNCKRITDEPFVGLQVDRYRPGRSGGFASKEPESRSVLVLEDVDRRPHRFGDLLRRRFAPYDTFIVCEASSHAPGVLDAQYPPGELRKRLDWLRAPARPAVVIFALRDRLADWVARIGRSRPHGAAVTLLTEEGARTIFNVGALFGQKEAA